MNLKRTDYEMGYRGSHDEPEIPVCASCQNDLLHYEIEYLEEYPDEEPICGRCWNNGQRVYRVRSENWEDFEAKFAALAKRAKRLDLPEPTFEVVGEEVWHTQEKGETERFPGPLHGQMGRAIKRRTNVARVVYLRGEAPKLPGWEFVAAIDHTPGDDGEYMNVVRTMEGKTCPPMYRQTGPHCDHCRTTRRRNATYVLLHKEMGDTMQVGSTCLRDFLGHKSPDSIARMAEWLADWAGFGDGFDEDMDPDAPRGRRSPFMPVEEYLPWVALAIRKNGWTSRGAAWNGFGFATADVAFEMMYARPTKTNPKPPQPQDIDRLVADRARVWVQEEVYPQVVTDPESEEYLWNLAAIGKAKVFNVQKQAGILASLIPAFQRAIGQKLYAERAAKRPPSEWIGEPGVRFGGKKKGSPEALEVTVLKAKQTDGMYGVSTLVTFLVDGTGNLVKWFDSSGDTYQTGDKYRLCGTVKKHEMLARCPKCRYVDFRYTGAYTECPNDGETVTVTKTTMLTRCTAELTEEREPDEFDVALQDEQAKEIALRAKNTIAIALDNYRGDTEMDQIGRESSLRGLQKGLAEYDEVEVDLSACDTADEVFEAVLKAAHKKGGK